MHYYQTARLCCLCKDGGDCLYTEIQWKTAASVSTECGNWANTTVEAKVRTVQKTMIPLFHAKTRQRVENAHERWGLWKLFNHRTARRSTHCFPLYLRGQRDAVCI